MDLVRIDAMWRGCAAGTKVEEREILHMYRGLWFSCWAIYNSYCLYDYPVVRIHIECVCWCDMYYWCCLLVSTQCVHLELPSIVFCRTLRWFHANHSTRCTMRTLHCQGFSCECVYANMFEVCSFPDQQQQRFVECTPLGSAFNNSNVIALRAELMETSFMRIVSWERKRRNSSETTDSPQKVHA